MTDESKPLSEATELKLKGIEIQIQQEGSIQSEWAGRLVPWLIATIRERDREIAELKGLLSREAKA